MTARQAADKLNRSKLDAQKVLQDFPSDASGQADLEMAIEHLGIVVDLLDMQAEEENR